MHARAVTLRTHYPPIALHTAGPHTQVAHAGRLHSIRSSGGYACQAPGPSEDAGGSVVNWLRCAAKRYNRCDIGGTVRDHGKILCNKASGTGGTTFASNGERSQLVGMTKGATSNILALSKPNPSRRRAPRAVKRGDPNTEPALERSMIRSVRCAVNCHEGPAK